MYFYNQESYIRISCKQCLHDFRWLTSLGFWSNSICCFSFKITQGKTDFSARSLKQPKSLINNLIWSLKLSSYIIMSLCYLHSCYKRLLLNQLLYQQGTFWFPALIYFGLTPIVPISTSHLKNHWHPILILEIHSLPHQDKLFQLLFLPPASQRTLPSPL